ncbi:MAG TPA: HAMP domain-containing sensor histidine kinase [Ideonella sp.]|uniref:sensor histidine kinase n=1 Tax=Ideonella sp. TaxID=1929293 RepID=UPI002E2F9173|nr:HAMP domain-containing sensor histidine kinase [Ideonella sp.]HEX5682838.1 HAMP domain-containing sensor histidine kinase [Ideonella sp.]
MLADCSRHAEDDTDDELRALREEVMRLRAFSRDVAHQMIGASSSMSHLAALSELALDRGEPERLATFLDLMRDESAAASALVEALMALAEPPQPPQDCDVVSLSACVAKAQRQLILAGRHESTAATPVVVGHLPMVWGNEALLTQVFVNLMGNALKFSRRSTNGRVEVFAQKHDDEVAICVHDNGVGFDDAQAERMFEPFHRSHGSAYPGHGLGLTVVRSIVEHHGGRVWAESQPGRGARFSVSLPVCSPIHMPNRLPPWADRPLDEEQSESFIDEARMAAWSHAFVASPDEVREAVRRVGSDVQGMGRYLLGLRPAMAQ